MRRMIRVSVVGVLAALAMAVGASPALALSADYTAAGVEIAATSTQGTFVGAARGSQGDAAAWRAVVQHAPLSPAASTAITGGSLTLVAITKNKRESVSGEFTGGSIAFVSSAPGCSTERFAVDGSLATTNGPATFEATLTHYRIKLFGQCKTYLATVSGILAFVVVG
jgi:hypothetical protein